MQQQSATENTKNKVLLVLAICFCVIYNKDLKQGFVEGYNSYKAIISIHSKEQHQLLESDFSTIQLILLNKNF